MKEWMNEWMNMHTKYGWLKLWTTAECVIASYHPDYNNQIMTWWKNEQKMAFYCFYWLIIKQINKEFYKNWISYIN